MHKKKVLIIAHNHPELFPGGAEICAYRLFLELKKSKEYTPVFLAATGRESREAHVGTPFMSLEGRADEFLFWGDNFDYFNQSQREASFLHRDLARFLSEQRPDIIHLHHTLRIGVDALQIIRNIVPKAMIIYTLHDFIPMCHRDGQMITSKNNNLCDSASSSKCHQCFPSIPSANFKLRESFIKTHFNLVDKFVSPSHLLADRFIDWGIPKEKMYVIENGVEIAAPAPYRPQIKHGRRDKFAFFGQISPYKGTLLLVEAAQILQAQDEKEFKIDIYGNVALQTDEFKEKFQLRLKEASHNVSYHGIYEAKDIAQLIKNVDWVVVPSIWWENSPLVIQEAFQHRRPVICSNIGGMAEKVENEVTGLHFRMGDAQSLAETMQRAMNEKGLWERLTTSIPLPFRISDCMNSYSILYEGKA